MQETEKYFLYEINGKTYKIPKIEINHNMEILSITQEEAIDMWLCDNDIEVNEIEQELTQKAKDNHITATIHEAKAETPRKTQRERVKKDDPIKEQIIQVIADAIKDFCGNAEITNKTKIIAFELEGEKYKIDLTRQRPPK